MVTGDLEILYTPVRVLNFNLWMCEDKPDDGGDPAQQVQDGQHQPHHVHQGVQLDEVKIQT